MAVARLACAALIACALASGCGKSSRGAGRDAGAPVDPALAAYRAGLAPLAKLEDEALAAVAAHTGAGYSNDDDLIAALKNTAIPRYREFVLGLEHLAAPPGPRAPLHQQLILLAHHELDALEHLAAALERGDGNAVLAVNREQHRLADEIDALLASWTQAGAPAPAVPQAASTSSTPSSDANSASK